MDLTRSLLELVDEDEASEASETPPTEVDEHIGKETSSRTPGMDVRTSSWLLGKTENTRADLLQPSLCETQRSSHRQIDPSDSHRILERDHARRDCEKGVKQRLRVYPCVLPPGQTFCFLR